MPARRRARRNGGPAPPARTRRRRRPGGVRPPLRRPGRGRLPLPPGLDRRPRGGGVPDQTGLPHRPGLAAVDHRTRDRSRRLADRHGPRRGRPARRAARVAGAVGEAGPAGTPGAAAGAVAAVARLGDPEREVVVLRLLLGHSLAHTAHLSGYSQRAVMELQLAACLSIQELTGGAHRRPARPRGPELLGRGVRATAGTLGGRPDRQRPGPGRRPGRCRVPTPGHPRLHGRPRPWSASSATSSAPGRRTGAARTAGVGAIGAGRLWTAPSTSRLDPLPSPSGGLSSRRSRIRPPRSWSRARGRRSRTRRSRSLSRRPWVATAVATAGIVVVLALQAFGKPAPPGTCDGRPCPASTTAAVAAAGGDSVGTPLSTVLQPTTTSTTVPALAPAPTASPTSAATAPPTTRPATTAPPTTAPRPTTTRAPTTTAPPTTAATDDHDGRHGHDLAGRAGSAVGEEPGGGSPPPCRSCR